MVRDQQRRLVKSVTTVTERAREEEEDRISTTDTMDDLAVTETVVTSVSTNRTATALLRALTERMGEGKRCYDLGVLRYNNQVVLLLLSLLGAYGVQFVSWLVGRTAEEVLDIPLQDRCKDLPTSLAEAAGTLGKAKGKADVDSQSGSQSALRRMPSVSAATPTSSSAAAARSSAEPQTKILGSFAESVTAADPTVTNRLLWALNDSVRRLDVTSALPAPAGQAPSREQEEAALLASLVMRLTELVNGVAGRMLPQDWAALSRRHTHEVDAFLCRVYAANLHPGVALRSHHIRHLEGCDG